MKKIAAVAAVLLAWLAAYAAATVMLTVTIQNQGNISTIVTQPPANLQVTPSSISWGTLEAGGSTTRTATLTCTGVGGTLGMNTTGLPIYLSLSWNCTGYTLTAGQSVTALFTLSAQPIATPGAFSFNITVTCS